MILKPFFRLAAFAAVAYLSSLTVSAQEAAPFDPTGHWSGGVLKDGAVLPVEVLIEAGESGYRAWTRFPQWIFYEPAEATPVEIAQGKIVIRDLYEGDAVLVREPRFGQLFGEIEAEEATFRVHLKRTVLRRNDAPLREEVTIAAKDGTQLSGEIFRPRRGEAKTGLVLVHGRGCQTGSSGLARFFAQQGLTVLIYDKRGAGQSEGDCASFTLDQLAEDVLAARKSLARQSSTDPAKIGFLGVSAGAWTSQRATELALDRRREPSPAFIATWIGPATSILQQQISSAYSFGEAIGFDTARQELLAEASRIIADQSLSDDEAYGQLLAIRERAQREGWLEDGFGPDDLPRSRDDMEGLWLRRLRYDPAPLFARLEDVPYLAVFGEEDPIVPLQENIETLRQGLAGKTFGMVTVQGAGHGYGLPSATLELPFGEISYSFEGTETAFAEATFSFLREQGFVTDEQR
ncbi:MAG: alpha/beta fold hydrolase [Parvularcula sp.]|jgi:pimeloyl-ACP methyl ester carboxylesterase|nr:alpha/beta fold hydrolase [Parvularcula sp.]